MGYDYSRIYQRWLKCKFDNKSAFCFFESNNIKKVVIYGAGIMGELLYEDIKKSSIEIKCFVDRSAEKKEYSIEGIPVVPLEKIGFFSPFDMVVITPMASYDSIANQISRMYIDVNVISIRDLIYSV